MGDSCHFRMVKEALAKRVAFQQKSEGSGAILMTKGRVCQAESTPGQRHQHRCLQGAERRARRLMLSSEVGPPLGVSCAATLARWCCPGAIFPCPAKMLPARRTWGMEKQEMEQCAYHGYEIGERQVSSCLPH